VQLTVDIVFGVATAAWLAVAFRPAGVKQSVASVRSALRWGVVNGLVLAAIVVGFLVLHGWPQFAEDVVFMLAYPLFAIAGFVTLALMLASRG